MAETLDSVTTSSQLIEEILSSKVRIRILVFLATNRDRSFTRYRISSTTGVSVKEVSKHMKILAEAKLVRAIGGGVTLYSFNDTEAALFLAQFLRYSVSNC